MTQNENTATCAVMVDALPGLRVAQYRPCGRRVKEDGMCGLHLAAKRRRKEKDAAEAERLRRSEEAHDQALTACEVLRDVGLTARPYYRQRLHSLGEYTGEVVVDGGALVEALRRGGLR